MVTSGRTCSSSTSDASGVGLSWSVHAFTISCFFFFLRKIFRNQPHPKDEEEGSTTKRRRRPSPNPQGRGRKAAPRKGRRTDRHSTELNLTSANPTNLHSFKKMFLIFIVRYLRLLSFYFFQMKGNGRLTQRRLRKAAPPKGGWGDITTTNFGVILLFLSLSFWMLPFFPSFG